jgi:hypothetical protein
MMTSTAGVNLVDRGNYPNQSSTSTASSSTTNSSNNININNNALNSNNANPIVDFSVGSMPANYGYDESFSKDDEVAETQFKPRILIMGLRK